MGRHKKRDEQLKDARETKAFKNQDARKKTILFILSILFTGMPYASAATMFLLNGINPPSLKETELYLPEVISALKLIAEESVTKAWEEMPEKATVSIDGSWDHRRNGKIMILDLICQQTHKIVDFEYLYKTIRKFTGN